MTRKEYEEQCRADNLANKDKLNYRVQYIRRGAKSPRPFERIGVIVTYRKGKQSYIGFSKCRTKLERFSPEIGIHKALNNTYTLADAKKLFTKAKKEANLPQKKVIPDAVVRSATKIITAIKKGKSKKGKEFLRTG